MNDSTTCYYYDGQMGISETYQYPVSGEIREDRAENVVGPRGVEMQRSKVHTGPWNTSYPVYDGHGNMIATLTFNRPAVGANGLYDVPTSYAVQLGNLRRYDVWGGVRGGQQTGYPNHRYCANLGHKVDDETGLIYMRARYYEPSTGRFISEDPARDGWNWYVYCGDDPVTYRDPSGLSKKSDIMACERIVQQLYKDGRISEAFYARFLNIATGLRREIHDLITGQEYTDDQIVETILKLHDERNYKDAGWSGKRGGKRFGVGIGYTSLDTAFQQDPVFVTEILIDIFSGGRR